MVYDDVLLVTEIAEVSDEDVTRSVALVSGRRRFTADT